MSIELTAHAVMSLAHTICDAASPPFPEIDPDAPIEEQAQQVTDWLIDSDYEDAHISISIGSARSADGSKAGFEVYIGPTQEPVSEADDWTFFVGYELFASDEDPDTAEGEVIVEIFKPGPWVDHLVRVARRALPIVQSRIDTGAL